VFGARDSSGKETLWLRSLSDIVPRPLGGTEGATYPFWSPDSRSIAFFAGGELRKIAAAGGPVEKICETLQGRGGTWNRKGVVVFAPGEGSLFQVPASGGTPAPLASTSGGGAMDALWPHFLPDGRHFLYVAVPRSSSAEVTVRVGSLDTDQERVVVPAASSVAYAPPGYLLFARGGNLVATPFDVNGFRVTGDPVVVAEAVHHHHYRLNADFSMSETGVLVYYGVADRSQLQWFDRRGRSLGLLGERAEFGGVRFSPDGSRCAVEIYNPRTSAIDVWLLDLTRGVTTRLTSRAMISDAPIWSPDGERILFSANPSGVWDLYLRASADVGEDELAYASGLSKTPTDWSRDGRFVAFTQCCEDRAGNVDIWVFSLADRSARPFLRTPFRETAARFSPDGRWIVYVSDEAGRPEVYARSFPTAEGKIRVSAEGGAQPL
jgi:Tol biopolymer transport system component